MMVAQASRGCRAERRDGRHESVHRNSTPPYQEYCEINTQMRCVTVVLTTPSSTCSEQPAASAMRQSVGSEVGALLCSTPDGTRGSTSDSRRQVAAATYAGYEVVHTVQQCTAILLRTSGDAATSNVLMAESVAAKSAVGLGCKPCDSKTSVMAKTVATRACDSAAGLF